MASSRPAYFNPDDDVPPVFDDREPRVVKVPDPVIQKRNHLSRRRGKSAERAWAALIERILDRYKDLPRELWRLPEVRGGLGGADVLWWNYACEVKQRLGDWPSNTVLKHAQIQAARNAQGRTPVVVACKTMKGLPREWRVLIDGAEYEGPDWIANVIVEALPK